MKINYLKLFLLCFYMSNMCAANDSKITQMIFVTKDNTHDKKPDLLYYVTEDHELYYIDGPKSKKSKCEIHEQNSKKKEYRSIEDRVMLIGQPINVKSSKDESNWILPAVIKQKGIFGILFNPELCLIEYKKINPEWHTIAHKPIKIEQELEEVLVQEPEEEEEKPSEFEYKFVVSKVGKGHRTKVTKIGLLYDKTNSLTLVSGSEWPTVKCHKHPDGNMTPINHPNTYLIDIAQNQAITSSAEKSWFEKKKWTFKSMSISENPYDGLRSGHPFTKQKKLTYLPNIFFDPSTNNNTNNFVKAFKEYVKFIEVPKDSHYHTCYIGDDYLVMFSSRDKSLFVKNMKKSEYKDLPLAIEQSYPDHTIVTATTFDFVTRTFFYATYDTQTKKHDILSQDLSAIIPKEEEGLI